MADRKLPATVDDNDRFLDTDEAARFLNLSPRTLETRRLRDPDNPPFFRMAQNKVCYLRSELLAWMQRFRVGAQIAPPQPNAQPRPWE